MTLRDDEHDPEYDPEAQARGLGLTPEVRECIRLLKDVAMIAAMRTNDSRNVRHLADEALYACTAAGL